MRLRRKKKIWMSCALARPRTRMPGTLVMATPANTWGARAGVRPHAAASPGLRVAQPPTHRTAHGDGGLLGPLQPGGLGADGKGAGDVGHELHGDAHCLWADTGFSHEGAEAPSAWASRQH